MKKNEKLERAVGSLSLKPHDENRVGLSPSQEKRKATRQEQKASAAGAKENVSVGQLRDKLYSLCDVAQLREG